MNARPLKPSQLDISKITFVQGVKKQGRIPPINIKHGDQYLNVVIQNISFPGGLFVSTNEKGEHGYKLAGTLKNCDPYGKEAATATDELSCLYNFLNALHEKLILAFVENSVQWTGKKRSEEVIRETFKPIISLSSDKVNGEYIPNGKYAPSISLKVPVWDGKVSTEIYDDKNEPMYVTTDSLPTILRKGVSLMTTISFSVYVMAGGGMGVTIRLQSCKLKPSTRLTSADIYRELEEEEQSQNPQQTQDEEEQPSVVETQEEVVEVIEEEEEPVKPQPTVTTDRKRRGQK
jgi:hypothetical protein